MSKFTELNNEMHEELKLLESLIKKSSVLKYGDLTWIQDGKFPRLSVWGFLEREKRKKVLPVVSTYPKPLKDIPSLSKHLIQQPPEYDNSPIRIMKNLEDWIRFRNWDDNISTIESICFVPKLEDKVLFYLYTENLKSKDLYAFDMIIEGQVMKTSPILETARVMGVEERYFEAIDNHKNVTWRSSLAGHIILMGNPVKNMVRIRNNYKPRELKKSPSLTKGKKIDPVNIGISKARIGKPKWVETEIDSSREAFLRHIYFLSYSDPKVAKDIILDADLFLHMFPKKFYNKSY